MPSDVLQVEEESSRLLAEREGYIAWIVWWNRWIAQDSLLNAKELRNLLELQSTTELSTLAIRAQQDTCYSCILWGAKHSKTATPEQRECVIDAIVRQDTQGLHNGTEQPPVPQAGECLVEAPLHWARARREQLEDLCPAKLAAECRKMLEVAAERATRHDEILALARSDASRRMRALVSTRYSYRACLIEVARHYRKQKVVAKGVRNLLLEKPHDCGSGCVVAFNDGKFVVRQSSRILGAVTEAQFRKEYWPFEKNPPTS
jgi:hypothetical protein